MFFKGIAVLGGIGTFAVLSHNHLEDSGQYRLERENQSLHKQVEDLSKAIDTVRHDKDSMARERNALSEELEKINALAHAQAQKK